MKCHKCNSEFERGKIKFDDKYNSICPHCGEKL